MIDVPFFVMGHVEGAVITKLTPTPLDTPLQRRRIGEGLVDNLVALHAVNWHAIGLAGMGHPEGFNRRHLRRMRRLIADDMGKTPAIFEAVEHWLELHVPAESGATIVHNDYRIGNVVVGMNAPARILAILDWELATLGDPLFDLGYFLASYPAHGEPFTPTMEMGTAVLEEGYPQREELAERYAVASGRSLENLNWYITMALWKLAALYEYGRRRAMTDAGDSYYMDSSLVQSFLHASRRVAGID